MSSQPQLQLNFTGDQLRDTGMRLALESANEKHDTWGDRCYQLLTRFITIRNQFTCEEFREWAQIETPPSLRAYGSVIMRAAKEGLIEKVGYIQVKNPKAHCANASLWHKT